MIRVKPIATACAGLMLAVLSLSVAAQDFNTNERTYLTFSSAVELPGVTLQPGTYLFRLADSQSNRHIVQVFSQDEKQVHATILAVPAERMEVTGETVVTFREQAEGGTPAVQYWYYPGDKIGHEFVYPREQAVRIAQRTGQNVLTADGEVASAGSTVSSVNPQGEVSEWKREETAATTAREESSTVTGAGVSETARPTEQPEPQPETVAPTAESPDRPGSETPPAERSAAAAQTDTRATTGQQTVGTAGQAGELPRTASPLPLSALIGLLSIGGALAIRRWY
jgi:hypothetical protein